MFERDFLIILVASVGLPLLMVLEGVAPPLHWIRVAIGLFFVLFVPGYCVLAAALPGAQDLDTMDRIGLSIGVSVASVAILTVLLDFVGLALDAPSLLLAEYVVSALFMGGAIGRRWIAKSSGESTASFIGDQTPAIPRLSRAGWTAMSIVALAMLVVTIALLAPIPSRETYTEFYVLGMDGAVANYPYDVMISDDLEIVIGVVNEQERAIDYRVRARVRDDDSARWTMLDGSRSFSLKPGAKFQERMSWTLPSVGDDQAIELLLFQDGAVVPSNQLRLMVNVHEAAPV